MSFFDDASLVQIPSGIKDGVLYSVKPIDGSGDLTFSRGSDIEATRVNANGYIEKAQVNLLTYSNDFSNAIWLDTSGSCTRTGGQAGYDGTNDAWLLTQDTDGFDSIINNTTAVTGVHTFSVYAKANTGNTKFTIRMGGTGARVEFDLTGGSVGTIDGAIDAQIESVGSGWYRCIAAFNCSSDQFRIAPQWASATAESVYIQDAQINYGLVAQTYQETTTAAVVSGITDDMPRLNYDPANPTCPSLLLEPSRQNLFPHSDLLTAWSQDSATTTVNQTTSPEGVVNGSLITATGATSIDHTIYQNMLSLSAGTYTASAYVKKNTQRYVHLTFNRQADSNEWAVANFDLDSGTSTNHSNILATPTSTITAVGSDWYRITLTAALTTAGNTFCFLGFSESGAPNTSRGRYAFISSDSFYAYGLQCELGSYESSLIPTYGSSATRTADDMDTTFASAFATDGSATIFFHELGVADSADIDATAGVYRYEKDGSNYVSLSTSASDWRVRIQSGGSSNFKGVSGYAKTSPIKVAIVVTSTTYSIYANGSAVIENDALNATADFSSIDAFKTIMGDDVGVRKTLQHLVFPTALTPSEAITLTTL